MFRLGGYELTLSSKFIRTVSIVALGFGLLQVKTATAASIRTTSLPLSAIMRPRVYAQPQVKSKIEQELEKKNTGTNKTEPSKKPKTGGRSGSSYTKYSGANDSTITILSDVPGTEISIDGNVVGKIGDNKKLTIKVTKGQHKTTASLKGYNSQSITISVFAERSSHTINLGKPIPAVVPLPAPVAKAEPTPGPPPTPPPPTADDVIRRFINPNETQKLKAEDWKDVISQSEETMKAEPANAQVAARLHLARGQVAYLTRNYAESLSEFNRAIEALPLSGIAYYAQGNAYLATNQPLQANKSYQRAAELTPEASAVAQKGIGDGLTKMAKSNEANMSYKRARDLGYFSTDLNKSIAINLIEEKQWQKALVELNAIEDSETSAEIQLYFGECYENLKRPLSAYRAYASASKLDPNSTVAFSKLGNLLFELNEFPEAKEAYERALALDTTGVVINRQLIRKLADRAASLSK